ncbi:hypothetical protein HAX54_043461, partial [Datura stramonium]|nr:hypothetical protein [Datura stramonium]
EDGGFRPGFVGNDERRRWEQREGGAVPLWSRRNMKASVRENEGDPVVFGGSPEVMEGGWFASGEGKSE